MTDLFNYHPRLSHEVSVGNRPLGGEQPLRIQSMTTAVTTDTEACVKQCIAIFDAGADYVRLTTQGTREAENLAAIRTRLHELGYDRPLVADVHFNPNVADVAAGIVEKYASTPVTTSTPPDSLSTWNIQTRSMLPNWNAWRIALNNSWPFAANTTPPCALA